jgi:hypothetical protein
MTKSLRDLIKNWEVRHGVTMDTMKRAKLGVSVKPVTAYQIAKALGCDDGEAKAHADQAALASEEASDEAKETA